MDTNSLPMRWIRLVVMGMLVVAAAFEGRGEPFTSRVAVLTFTPAGGTNQTEDLSGGLSDLMELALQERGIPVYTRQFIRLVLDERRLVRREGAGEAELFRQALPDIRFLVKGEIARKGADQFALEIKVVDLASGVEAHSFAGAGVYPAGVQAVMARSVEGWMSEHGIVQRPVPQSPPVPGFTETPEAAVPFYRGVELFCEGRPASALGLFARALAYDPSFLTARLWLMRAFEALGLPDHAQIEYSIILDCQAASGTNLFGSSTGASTNRSRLVTVLFVNRDWAFDPDLTAQIKDRMRDAPLVSLYSPQWLLDFAEEGDLRRMGDFGALNAIDKRIWMQSDEVAVFFAEGSGTAKRLRGRVVNLVRGSVGEASSPANDPESLVRKVLAMEGEGNKSDAYELKAEPPVQLRRVTLSTGIIENNTFQDDPRFGERLLGYALSPTSRPAMIEVMALLPKVHQHAVMRRWLAGIRPEEPYASSWEYVAAQRLAGFHLYWTATNLEAVYGRLLSAYPDSLEAAWAHEALSTVYQAKKPDLAASHRTAADAWFEQAWARCEQGEAPAEGSFYRLHPAYFMERDLARAERLAAVGESGEATRLLERVERIRAGLIRKEPQPVISLQPGLFSMDQRKILPVRDRSTVADKDPGNPVPYWSDLAIRVENLGLALRQGAREVSLSPEALKARLRDARRPEDVLRYGFRFLESCPVQDGGRDYPRLLYKIYKAASGADVMRVKEAGARLAAGMEKNCIRDDVLCASGNFDALEKDLAEQEAAHGGELPMLRYIRTGVIAHTREGPRAEAEACGKLIDRWLSDPPKEVPITDLCLRNASHWEWAGETNKAVETLEKACHFQSKAKNLAGTSWTANEECAFDRLAYFLADAYVRQGRLDQAFPLLRDIVNDERTKAWTLTRVSDVRDSPYSMGLIFMNTPGYHFNTSIYGNMYERTLILLEKVRKQLDH